MFVHQFVKSLGICSTQALFVEKRKVNKCVPAIHDPNSCTKKSYDLHVMYQKSMVQGRKKM